MRKMTPKGRLGTFFAPTARSAPSAAWGSPRTLVLYLASERLSYVVGDIISASESGNLN